MKKGLNITLSVISKIIEVACWIASVAGVISFVGSLVDKEFIRELIAEDTAELSGMGFDVSVLAPNGDINFFAVTMCFIGLALLFVLMALVFRNLNIILRTISGKYKNAESISPFQKDVVRRVREIGIFSISIPVLSFAITTIITAVSLINSIPCEVSVSLDGVVIGLVCFCLTQIFTYGAKLEEEVDGLL
ncbi:MAG: hypothetical protein IJD68_00285 [Ruminococcus sp.]|nr:hypothetical protein [Ruminococcus sp.]